VERTLQVSYAQDGDITKWVTYLSAFQLLTRRFAQTIAGGSGAGPGWHGTSGVHTHITNTRIGDPEILERRYPVLLHRFEIRDGSGGDGEFRGGDGVIREFEFLQQIQVSILSEVGLSNGSRGSGAHKTLQRRSRQPYGLHGGQPAEAGRNLWVKQLREGDGDAPGQAPGQGRDAREDNLQEPDRQKPRVINIGGKATVLMGKGDRFVIETPGGGGWGARKPVESKA
jgi:5-oxoprolinase (ATP-hydrolysing)